MQVMSQIAGALAFAHAAGVIHRDIKPSNIFLLGGGSEVADPPSSDVPFAKLVDFGNGWALTNSMATGAYRGAGRPEANYLMERLMEKAAREMRLDPIEIRRRNFIRPENFPYRTHLGDVYDSGNFPRIVDQLVELADWEGFAARREQSRSRGRSDPRPPVARA